MSNLIKETIKKKEKERKKRTSLRLFVLKIVGNEIVRNGRQGSSLIIIYSISRVLIIPAQSISERRYRPIQVLQSGEAPSKGKRST